MNNKGIAQIELALFLFFLSLSLLSFCKLTINLQDIEKKDLDEFTREWNKFTTSKIQRVYKQEETRISKKSNP